jgi:hypothetical protein
MSVIVMICFARSGGTVLNRCLGSLPDVVMMSEVNPLGGGLGAGGNKNSFTTVAEQAKHWYQIELKSKNFTENILELEEICEKNGKQLVLRDWSFVNFAPYKHNDFNPPNRLITLETLESKCNLIPFAFIRDAIDAGLSRDVALRQFSIPYLRYVKSIIEKNIRIFKYEDFCHNPEKAIRDICAYTGLKYSESYTEFFLFDTVNGDIQHASRGNKCRKIELIPRKRISKDRIAEIDESAEIAEANTLLGYPTSYFSSPLEARWLAIKRAISTRLRNIISGF